MLFKQSQNNAQGEMLETKENSVAAKQPANPNDRLDTTDLILPDKVLDESGLSVRLGSLSFWKSIRMTVEKDMQAKFPEFATDGVKMPRFFFHGSKDTFEDLKPSTILLSARDDFFHCGMYATMMMLPKRIGWMVPWLYLPPMKTVPYPSLCTKDDLAPIKDFCGPHTSDGRAILGYMHVLHIKNDDFWKDGYDARVCEFDAHGSSDATGPTKKEGGNPPGKICGRKNSGRHTDWLAQVFGAPDDTQAPIDAWIMHPDVLEATGLEIIHHYRILSPKPSGSTAPFLCP